MWVVWLGMLAVVVVVIGLAWSCSGAGPRLLDKAGRRELREIRKGNPGTGSRPPEVGHPGGGTDAGIDGGM